MHFRAAVLPLVLAAAAPCWAQTGTGNPAVMAPATPQSAPNQNDRLFVMEATIGGRAEVEFAQLAGQKTRSQAVGDFARQMVMDHGRANQQLAQLAQAANIAQPDQLDEAHRAMRSALDKLSGADFDFAYVQGQIQDHQQTAQLLEWEIGSGQDPQLKNFASQILPSVLHHLEMASAIKSQLGVAMATTAPGGAPAATGRPAPR